MTLTTADVVKEDSPVPGQLSLARWTAIENSGGWQRAGRRAAGEQ